MDDHDDTVDCSVDGSAEGIRYEKDGPKVSAQTATVHIKFYKSKN